MMPKTEAKTSLRPFRIWSVGYGSLSKEHFLSLMSTHNINIVVDVRRWPVSKIDHFNKEKLKSFLRDARIAYVWLGDKLGGFRMGGYQNYMNSKEFEEGVNSLVSLLEKGNVCLLCLEPDPHRCHRRYIAEKLSSLGLEVVDIKY